MYLYSAPLRYYNNKMSESITFILSIEGVISVSVISLKDLDTKVPNNSLKNVFVILALFDALSVEK